LLCGLIIIGYSIFIYSISSDFTYAARPSKENLVYYSIVRIIIGLIYTFAVVLIVKTKLFNPRITIFIFVSGFIARLILVPTEPILEDDFNRYLWDGAVTANGYNPFKYPPDLFISEDSVNNSAPQKLYDLADSSGNIIHLINHPHIRTIYPPIAQGAFAVSYLFQPWSTLTWKALLLFIDTIVFCLLIILLKKLKYPIGLVLIYWWNPVLLHEIFNAGHMDLIMYPLILMGILFFLKDKIIASVSFFALAVGGKIWPIIFIPFILKRNLRENRVFIPAFLISSAIILLIFLPIIITKLDNSLGFITYTKNWTNNESIFQIVSLLIKQIINLFEINYNCSLCVARWITFVSYAGLVLLFLVKGKDDNTEIIRKFFFLVAIMYLISPTQFPWYYTWVLPLLVLNPRLSFIAYAIFLPLYQLKYTWPYLVWVEHIPIIVLFTIEIFNSRLRNFLMIDRINATN